MAFDDDMADRLRCTLSYVNHLQLDYDYGVIVIEDEGQVDITQRDLDAFDSFYYSNSTFSFVRYTTTKAIDMREERSGLGTRPYFSTPRATSRPAVDERQQ